MKTNIFVKSYNFLQKNYVLKKIKLLLYWFDSLVLIFLRKGKYINQKKKKVLILYNLALGDGVIFSCSCKDYRKIYPKDNFELTLICQNGVQSLYSEINIFDKIIAVDFLKSAVNPIERVKTIKKIREVYYDIVIDPVGIFDYTTNVLMVRNALGKEKIGIIDYNKKIFISDKFISKIYTKTYTILEKEILPLIEYYQKVINLISNNNINHEVGLIPTKTGKCKIKLPKKYFVIFPGASIELKRWPIERYKEIAQKIYDKTNMPLVVCGTEGDRDSVEELLYGLNIEFYNFLGMTNLNDYFCIIKQASFVITNDTSAYHISVANETPVVIVSGCYDYSRYIEYNFKRKNEFKKPYLACVRNDCINCNENCKYFKKNDKTWKCLAEVTVEMVWNKIEQLLKEEGISD